MQDAALIAGSSKGIGAAIAKTFARTGFHSFVTYCNDQASAERTASEIEAEGGSSTVLPLDVTSEDSVVAAYERIAASNKQLGAVAFSAVREIPKPVDQASLNEWHKVLLTKMDGAFLVTKYAIPLLVKADNPSITYITSIDGERPNGEYIGYQAGTAGIIAITKAHAVYLAKNFGIRCNAVSPGPVRTPLWDALGGDDEGMWERFAEASPMKRIATVQDVSDACLFLATDPHKFLNGVFINVDGGSRWV